MAPGSKSRLTKAVGAEPAGQMKDEKLHAVVARSACGSQNAQNTSGPEHFSKLKCPKSARRCGAKHVLKSKRAKHFSLGAPLEGEILKKCMPLWCEANFKSKCTRRTILGRLLEVEMLKKCTPFWREVHLEVKMYKAPQLRSIFRS